MTPDAARRWVERRGYRLEDTSDERGCHRATAQRPGAAYDGRGELLWGKWLPTFDASLVALVESLRAPRREPSLGWMKLSKSRYRTNPRGADLVLSVIESVERDYWMWAVDRGPCMVACGQARTLRLAQLAAERAARRAARLRGGK